MDWPKNVSIVSDILWWFSDKLFTTDFDLLLTITTIILIFGDGIFGDHRFFPRRKRFSATTSNFVSIVTVLATKLKFVA